MSESILRTKSKEFAKNIVFLCRKMKQNKEHSKICYVPCFVQNQKLNLIHEI